jgi:hypothetical protein
MSGEPIDAGYTVIEDCYLGDGVYASFDGHHIVLDLRAQDKSTRICLEPQVMEMLKAYEKSVYDQITAYRKGEHE